MEVRDEATNYTKKTAILPSKTNNPRKRAGTKTIK
jgi:hypothetical protein